MHERVLDVCCGSRMFWFDQANDDAVFMDIREYTGTLCDGRSLEVKPDIIGDFRAIPFEDETFSLVVFDPPHLCNVGASSWTALKYGKLSADWRSDLKQGFSECFRVLKAGGVLVFKWNETQIPVSEILKLSSVRPLFGHRSGKRSNTHWICFIK